MIGSAEFTAAHRPRTKRHTARGELMVTPTTPITMTIGGRRERLTPDRDRFAPDHEAVRKRPDLFRACDPKDTLTASELRMMVARSSARSPRQPSRTTSEPPWSLGPPLTRKRRIPPRNTGRRLWEL